MRSRTQSRAPSRASVRRHRAMAGAAAVEFSLIFPLLMLIVFGAIEFSAGFYDKAVITNASREAARAAVVLRTSPWTATQIKAVATSYCQNKLVTFGAAATCAFPGTITPCTATSSGNALTVQVSYAFNGLLLGPLMRPFTGPLTIYSSTTMLCE